MRRWMLRATAGVIYSTTGNLETSTDSRGAWDGVGSKGVLKLQ